MKFPLKNPMLVTCRIKGPSGIVRELGAILDPNSEYCALLVKDAHDLGYGDAVIRPRQFQKLHPDRAPLILDFRGIERSNVLLLSEVSVGTIVAKDVETAIVELDLPRLVPFDVILGRTFLKYCRLTVDFPNGSFTLDGIRYTNNRAQKRTSNLASNSQR